MIKRKWPLLVCVGGLCLIGAGFVYDVFFAGIPYQDPTPELESQFQFHKSVASVIGWTGLGAIALGITGGIIRKRTGGSRPGT